MWFIADGPVVFGSFLYNTSEIENSVIRNWVSEIEMHLRIVPDVHIRVPITGLFGPNANSVVFIFDNDKSATNEIVKLAKRLSNETQKLKKIY